MNILAITTMRNEGPHCLEWFAHHLAAGVGHFLVYSNDCSDGTDAMLDLLADAGLLTHVQLPPGKRSVQWQALKHASTQPLYLNADWVLVSDCDEFINLQPPLTSLSDLIEKLPGADAVAMPWRLFGNAGNVDMQDRLTTERFQQCAPIDIALPLAHFFKSLFRPAAFRQIGVHRPKRKKNQTPKWVDCGGQKLPDSFAQNDNRINLFGMPVSNNLVQLNHYSVRSCENFMVKRARGLPNHMERDIGLGYWIERNFNAQTDSSINHMIPATRAKLAELLAIPRLANLHQQSLAAHQQIFNKMMSDPDQLRLFWQLVLSGSSQPPDPGQTRAHIQRISRNIQA